MNVKFLLPLMLLVFIWSCGSSATKKTTKPETHSQAENNHGGHGHGSKAKSDLNPETLTYPKEKHIKNLKQLTFGGDNAEAYFSFDNQNLVFQATNEKWGVECDQIYTMPINGHGDAQPKMISTGKGRTTCSYFMPGNQEIIFASTHHNEEACPKIPRTIDGKYVWGVTETYDIFIADLEGNIKRQLTKNPGYDAEPTVSPDGKKIVFTSTRSGDLELWTMDIDGSNMKQVTKDLGYDGGAFFSPDSKQLIFRSSRPKTPEAIKDYKDLLSRGLVQPTNMELYVCNVDGSDLRQITDLGGANWAPFFHPSGKKVVFSSNHHSRGKGRPQFNLFSINLDGTDVQQLTYDGIFDAFPMFSPDGKKLVFSSNRNNGGTRDTNVFLADWVE